MVMMSREIIQRHLEFAGPDRIGLNFTDGRADDFCEVWLGPSPVWRERRWTEGRQEFYTDEWGNTWFRMAGMGRGGEIYQPALTEWDQLKDYRLPDMAAPERYPRRAGSSRPRRSATGSAGCPGSRSRSAATCARWKTISRTFCWSARAWTSCTTA